MNVPKFIRVNVYNLPLPVLQTTYYAHSAEVLGDCLVVDIRVDDPIPITSSSSVTMNDSISTKFDLAPIKRAVNVNVGTIEAPIVIYDTDIEETEAEETEVEDEATQTQDAQEDIFVPLEEILPDTQETLATIPEEEHAIIPKKRKSKNPDAIWFTKKRKPRSDKGKPRGIECEVCMFHRELLHACKVCKHSFCKFCFEHLVDHDFEMEVCNVCKREF